MRVLFLFLAHPSWRCAYKTSLVTRVLVSVLLTMLLIQVITVKQRYQRCHSEKSTCRRVWERVLGDG